MNMLEYSSSEVNVFKKIYENFSITQDIVLFLNDLFID